MLHIPSWPNLRKICHASLILCRNSYKFDEEIDKLKTDILKDQQIIDDIQVTQRNEIMNKEKAIYALNKASKEQREEWIRKEKELNKFEGNSLQGS